MTTDRAVLPMSFNPSSRDVICGRSKSNYYHAGNEFFREVVATYLSRYTSAKSKVEKGCVIVSIVEKIRNGSPEAGFVQKDPKTRGWFVVDDTTAREKVGATIRSLIKTLGVEKPLCELPNESIDKVDPDPLVDWIPPSIVVNMSEEVSLRPAEDVLSFEAELSTWELSDAALWTVAGFDLEPDEFNMLLEETDDEKKASKTDGQLCSKCSCVIINSMIQQMANRCCKLSHKF